MKRTDFDDRWYRDRHREWGSALYMTDIDGLCVEVDGDETLAIVELKHRDAMASGTFTFRPDEKKGNDWQFRVLGKLAKKARLPLLLIVYSCPSPDYPEMKFAAEVKALNQLAASRYRIPREGWLLSEWELVRFLYHVHGVTAANIPPEVEELCSKWKPADNRPRRKEEEE